MRFVLDTDVIVAAMRSPQGASAALLVAAFEKRITILANVALVIEYEAVCQREQQRLAAGLNERETNLFLDGVATLVEPVETHFLWRPSLRDPADEMVLEAAVNGRANAIVTFNLRDYKNVPSRFGLDIYNPCDALRRIKQ